MTIKSNVASSPTTDSKKHSAFTAVFIPVTLTLLSVVFFLRMGFIVACSSLLTTSIIISIAVCISLITALSISSVATNMRIGSGGLYFILSRTFGIEVASATCLPLFLAQSLGIALYIMGFSEALSAVFPSFDPKQVCLITLVLLTILASISAKSVLKAQSYIFIFVAFGLVSFFLGQHGYEPQTHSNALQIPKLSFWTLS